MARWRDLKSFVCCKKKKIPPEGGIFLQKILFPAQRAGDFICLYSRKAFLKKRKEDAMEDEKIIEMFFERSEEALAFCSEKYGAYCRAVARNILQNEEDAEECVNDAFLNAWENIPPNRPEKLGAYLGKITHNLALNRLKYYSAEKRGNGQADAAFSELEECIPAEDETERKFDEALLINAINAFLYASPAEKHNIFIRRYWYFCPVKDIAKAYGMSESKVKSLLFRMRKELKKHLEKEGIFL